MFVLREGRGGKAGSTWSNLLTSVQGSFCPEYPGSEVSLEWLHELPSRDEDVALTDHHQVGLSDLVAVPGEVPLPESLGDTVTGGGHVNLHHLAGGPPVAQLGLVLRQLGQVRQAGLEGHGDHHLDRGQSQPEVGGQQGGRLTFRVSLYQQQQQQQQ